MKITDEMLNDLASALATGASQGDIKNNRWKVTWRFGERRIEDKVRPNVLRIHHVELAERYRGRGYLTELLRRLDELPELGGRRFSWIYFDQVNFRLANHLVRELHYRSETGMVIDCWRQVTGQLEMKL
ncbi:acyl-CoA synthetase protein [Rhizobium phage RHph_N1_15]|nr:acyl-CoA synthetase protein [Rhizobium phage RHph_N1_10]QIG69355.1 acyl-CoA synthetase protein [Rhizobium phage RHph_N1_15]QIG75215.1 acyl-CoA synthetase protein [Rhizobium phage RHph_N2_6]